MKRLLIFDLDGTLVESKQPIKNDVALLIEKLLAVTKVASISGAALPQFLKQVVSQLNNEANLTNLFILPTSGAALYDYLNGDWRKIYEERLSERDRDAIFTAIRDAVEETGFISFSDPAWGERIEYRGGQITFSAFGQEAPLAEKKAWDPDRTKRHDLQVAIAERLPEFSVGIGGATSIDITKRGIDKAYGIRQLCARLNIPESDALYVGDELEPGGNDEAVFKTAVETKSVKGPSETFELIKNILRS